jgi:5-methyltetrahydropteroyltriglutamate--homocysteine methyltransferase
MDAAPPRKLSTAAPSGVPKICSLYTAAGAVLSGTVNERRSNERSETMTNPEKYRADQIGSLLRPPELLKARAEFAAGRLDEADLRTAEDAAIRQVLALQQEAGVDVVTDGEFRRSDFRAGLADAVDGMRTIEGGSVWHSAEGDKKIPVKTWYVDGKLHQRRRLTDREAGFLRENTRLPKKVTLIAPGFMAGRSFKQGVTDEHYSSVRELADEIVAITRREIEALIADGIQYIQIDNPGYAYFLDRKNRDKLQAAGQDPDRAFQDMLETDLAALEGLQKPEGTTIGIHICRGNNASFWLNEGDYEPIAEKLFTLPVDRFLLEYDDARSGGFEPLRFVPKDKIVVLGLVSTKSAALEDADTLLSRIDAAGQFIDPDNLAISPQCGFATHAEGGNSLSVDQEKRKLQLVADVAHRFWG